MPATKDDTSNRGFASMDEDRRREISRKGGESVPDEKRSFSKDPGLASEAGRKGGQNVPGAKRSFSKDHELASQAGRKAAKRRGATLPTTPNGLPKQAARAATRPIISGDGCAVITPAESHALGRRVSTRE